MNKIVVWVAANVATIFGILQAVVKLIKELCTGIMNMLFPFFPDGGKFEKAVMAVRAFIDIADAWLESIKKIFIPS